MSMDFAHNLEMTDKDEICGRWILKQNEAQLGGPVPGTTFPPFSHNLHYFKERISKSMPHFMDLRLRCKCFSEADLSKLEQSESFQESSECNNHDEDHLFEFDIGSSASDEGSVELDSDLDNNLVFNVIEKEGERTFSISSDSSSCTHSKENPGSTGGVSTIFCSNSSGVGISRRTCCGDVSEDTPSLWKKSCVIETNTRYPAEGSATPILAVSPQVDSPVVSPDSCLDEESILEDQNLCIECASSHSFQVQNKEIPTPPDVMENNIETIEDPSIKESEIIKISSQTPQPGLVEINACLHVSTDKLNSLLRQLEVDKFYPNEEEEDDILCSLSPIQCHETVRQRSNFKKCFSLKSNRTPKVTSGFKKFVRFADILGLDLCAVKTFSEEIPRIPRSAFDDLDMDMVSDYETGSPISQQPFLPNPTSAVPTNTTSLVPMFNQPDREPHFLEKVMDRKVCLENAFMVSPSAISGVVRVENISFHKSVTVKWTVDDWITVTETGCEYMQDRSKGNTDKFSFNLVVGSSLPVGSRLKFCIKYHSEGEHWDNNGGDNYVFQVLLHSSSRSLPMARHKDIGRNSSRQLCVPFPSHSPSQHGDDHWLRSR